MNNSIYVLLIVVLLLCFFSPLSVLAAGFGNFEVPLPGFADNNIDVFVQNNQNSALLKYVSILINIVTAVIIIIGLIGIVIGGYFYMTARGSADQVGKAKTWILSSLLGIALALGAWIILNTISPQFTTGLQEPQVGIRCTPGQPRACPCNQVGCLVDPNGQFAPTDCPANGICPL